MAVKLFPSSFKCDCGFEADFFENTVWEMERMSKKKRVRLSEGSGDEIHSIVFYKGEAIEIICPKLGTCKITHTI